MQTYTITKPLIDTIRADLKTFSQAFDELEEERFKKMADELFDRLTLAIHNY